MTTHFDPDNLELSSPEDRRQRGLAVYRELMAQEPPAVTSPRAAALIDFVFAEIWPRPGLSLRDRRLIALTCAGGADATKAVGDLMYGALKCGDLSHDELNEFVLHFAIYCGWPKGEALESILEEQVQRLRAEGDAGPAIREERWLSVAPTDQELRKQGGEQEFRDVNCIPAPTRGIPYYEFGILHYVFGEMWKRPGLTRRDRRLITIASVGLDDTIGPIRSHVYSAMKSGDLTLAEMREIVFQFAAYSGWPKAAFLTQSVEELHEQIRQEAQD
jgi:4-carboxymuconolactone decarboxylase